MLFTPRTVLRLVDGSDGSDLTKELVLVVPAGARVSISSLGLCDDTENLSAEGNVQVLRHDIVWCMTLFGELPLCRIGRVKLMMFATNIGTAVFVVL